MKSKLCLATLVGLFAGSLAGFAQTNTPADVPAAAPATNSAPDAAAARVVPVAEADPVIPVVPQAHAAAGGVIPLIVMDDVPLTDAIKNLARQADINYMLDPKVTFGQVGPEGKPAPQPMVSIRWENISAQQALAALLGNYNLQLVEDPRSKIARVTLKDPAAPDPLITKVIQLQYAGPSNILATVQSTFTDKRSKVIPDVRTSQLVVLATEKEMAQVDRLVASLDTPTKQVLIETRLLETTVNPNSIKGVDWTGTLAAQHVRFGNNVLGASAPNPPTGNNVLANPILSQPNLIMSPSAGSFFNPSMAFLNADGVAAVLSFLNTYAEAKIVSSPRTVTLDNQQATIEVGTMYPVVNTSAGTQVTAGGSQISYSNLTVRLDVTPRISAQNLVNLKVRPSVTRLGNPVTSKVNGVDNRVDSFLTRSIDTAVVIPSGNTLVMGGLVQDAIDLNNTKVPVLGDIPVLGYLFRSDSKNRNKQNLTIFLTPTIVQDQDFQPTETTFLKTPAMKSEYLEPDWSAWDSGQPKDWSNKADAAAVNDPAKFSKLPTE